MQELLAPKSIVFFNTSWRRFGRLDKSPEYKSDDMKLVHALSRATSIDQKYLSGPSALKYASIAECMSWASNRRSTRLEDRAYSLLGIFGINMPLLYGEGAGAFLRLQKEIIQRSSDRSIFAWQVPCLRTPSCLAGCTSRAILAPSPSAFGDSRTIYGMSDYYSPKPPHAVANQGLDIQWKARLLINLRWAPQNDPVYFVVDLACITREYMMDDVSEVSAGNEADGESVKDCRIVLQTSARHLKRSESSKVGFVYIQNRGFACDMGGKVLSDKSGWKPGPAKQYRFLIPLSGSAFYRG